DACHACRQFGVQLRKRRGIRGALRAHDEIDGGKGGDGVASENLSQASAQSVAGHRGELKAGNDERRAWVAQRTRVPRQAEMLGAQAATLFPAGSELRAAREAHAPREPLSR